MELATGITERPSYKLLRKLAPSRWRHTRNIRSQEELPIADAMTRAEDDRAQPYHHYTLVSGFTIVR